MKHALRNVAAGCAGVALLMGASAGAANAYYLGYGNGDPGNWSFYQEQHPHHAKAHNLHRTAMHHHYASAQENKRS